MKHELESRLPGEKSVTSDMQMTPPLWQRAKKLKSLLMKVKEKSEKNWLKSQHSKNEDYGIWSHHFMGIDGETVDTVDDFNFGGLQNHCRW